ncbi:MAG: DUF2911 domain-containing protein [Terriglobales bacterium]
MRKIQALPLLLALAAMLTLAAAQKAPLSPPAVAQLQTGGKTVVIHYSAPSLRGRTNIFAPGGLISHDPHYPVWRAGANAATSFDTTAQVKLGTLSVPAGKYTLYVSIAHPNRWVLIVNKQTGQWGLTYNSKLDLGRTPMRMTIPPRPIQRLKYILTAHQLTLEWGKHIATVPLVVH